MVQVDEDALPRAVHVADAGLGRHVLEGAIATIAEKMATPVPVDHEQIEPSVVVIVGERRVRRAGGKRDARRAGDVAGEATAQAKEVRNRPPLLRGPDRHEQVVVPIAIDVTNRECHRGASRKRPTAAARSVASLGVEKTGVVGHIREPHGIHRRARSHAAESDEIRRVEGEYGSAGNRALRPLHFFLRRLVWLGGFQHVPETIERSARLRQLLRAKELNRAVEIDARFGRRLGRNAAHLLELPNGAVRLGAFHLNVEEL